MRVAMIHTQYGGIGYYRSWVPEKWIRTLGLAETFRYPDDRGVVPVLKSAKGEFTNKSIEEVFEWADVICMMRTDQLDSVSIHGAARDCFRKKMLLDMDDDVFTVARDNPARDAFAKNIEQTIYVHDEPFSARGGCWEGTTEDGRKVYAGRTADDIKAIAALQMQNADGLTLSTPSLMRRYKKFNRRTFVLPNAMDLEDFRPEPKRGDGRVRIGYAGSNSHYLDLNSIWDVLMAIQKRYDNVDLVFSGCLYDYIYDEQGARIESNEHCEIREYPKNFARMQFDIGIAPLLDTPFNIAKSNLKWLENATQRTPTVCSAVEPFLNSVTDGKNGMLARSQAEWFQKLSRLVESESERKRMGSLAYDEMARLWNAETMAKRWMRVLEGALRWQ